MGKTKPRTTNAEGQTAGDTARDITVLKGLEAVRRRPAMYIGDVSVRGLHHLVYEVVDNSIDEALAGYAKSIEVLLNKNGSVSVIDDGRGIPIDIHKDERRSALEVVITVLHAGGKFDKNSYKVSGGLHGVGVSVVNALSQQLEVEIKRDGQQYRMTFAHGLKTSELEVVGSVGPRNSGTRLRFWPDPRYFDTPRFSVKRLKHTLRAKAVLCPGLQVRFVNQINNESETWFFRDGLRDYLNESLADSERLPEVPFVGTYKGEGETVDWAMAWLPEGGETVAESYVNLIPTPLGGTHVNGFRSGLLASLREFCDFRKLLPRGVKLAPEDVWDRLGYVLSVKMQDPQFSGQTKERLGSRHCAGFVSGAV